MPQRTKTKTDLVEKLLAYHTLNPRTEPAKVLTRFSSAEHAKLRIAADVVGVSMQEFVHNAVLGGIKAILPEGTQKKIEEIFSERG